MIQVYIAGPLFTEADIAQRLLEGQSIRYTLEDARLLEDSIVFNPIETPVNFKDTNPTSTSIFEGDYDAIAQTSHFFFDLSNQDTGTFVELGIALEMYRRNREAVNVGMENPIHIYPVFSDIRIPNAGVYDGIHVPVGNNQFVIGALEYYGIPIYKTFGDALEQFELDVVHQTHQE